MALMGTSIAYGQLTVSRQVIGSAGAQIEDNNFSVCNTIGETVTATSVNGSLLVTQGLQQQGNKVNVSIDIDSQDPLSIRIFPNPTTDAVSIETDQPLGSFEIYSLSGKLVGKGTIANARISFAHYAKGTYVIRLLGTDGELRGNAKIVKQ